MDELRLLDDGCGDEFFGDRLELIPRDPAATFAQLNAILGGREEHRLELYILPERPLTAALAEVDAELDREIARRTSSA